MYKHNMKIMHRWLEIEKGILMSKSSRSSDAFFFEKRY